METKPDMDLNDDKPMLDEPCAVLNARGEWDQFHTTKTGTPRVRNRYAGTCYFCGTKLAPGYGYIGKSKGEWYTTCAILPPPPGWRP